jgi:hypothetical protein
LPTPSPSPTPVAEPGVWFDESIPAGLRQKIQFTQQTKLAASAADAHVRIGVVFVERGSAQWIYAVAAPFPTVVDGIQREDLRRLWRGETVEAFDGKPLMVSASTRAAFEAVWGPISGNGVITVAEDELIERAWEERPTWALVPFEKLEPRWKVLQVDGVSPLEKNFNPDRYPLVVRFGIADSAFGGIRLSFPRLTAIHSV